MWEMAIKLLYDVAKTPTIQIKIHYLLPINFSSLWYSHTCSCVYGHLTVYQHNINSDKIKLMDFGSFCISHKIIRNNRSLYGAFDTSILASGGSANFLKEYSIL